DSLFFGGVLAIASTSIIVRAFEELNVKNQKFAGIVLGVLVIEDLVAVVLMVVLTTVSVSRTFEGGEMIFSVLKLLFFLIIWFVGGIFFIPTVFKVLRKYLTGESLMILSIALCFAMVYFANMAGFSPALGAFIMGSILAETSKAEKISEGIHSIKNLFGAIFFVSVGMLINPELLIEYWRPVLAAVLILLIVKPLFVAAGALLTGQPLKTAVQSGMSLSQIGEFSFIIATLGLTLNVTSEFLYPVAVAVSVITTFTTPFMIRFSEPVYVLIDKKLPLKWKEKLNNYSFASRQVNEVSAWRKLVKFYLINLILFSTIILAITLLSTKFVLPSFQSGDFGKHLVAGTTLLALAPFLWALAFRKLPSGLFTAVLEKPFYRGPVIALLLSRIVLAIILIGFFFYQTYSSIAAITGVLISLILLFVLRKRISDFYARIETRFISNLKAREQLEKKYSALVPWDAHITKIELESISWMAGKKLKELRLRENFGINIAVIQRGDIYINVP
ncbi:MAG: cation:proton antiporter, partial [Crocinitomicaceae bacterium]|nr:cation:proton antiporter [Crocinitomicaceae bacterium]